MPPIQLLSPKYYCVCSGQATLLWTDSTALDRQRWSGQTTLLWTDITALDRQRWSGQTTLVWTDNAGLDRQHCSGQTTLAHAYTICVISLKEERSPPSTVRQRTPPLSSLCPSDKCELPVPRLRTAQQDQDQPAEPLP